MSPEANHGFDSFRLQEQSCAALQLVSTCRPLQGDGGQPCPLSFYGVGLVKGTQGPACHLGHHRCAQTRTFCLAVRYMVLMSSLLRVLGGR